MAERLMIDDLVHWATHYRIDGFRCVDSPASLACMPSARPYRLLYLHLSQRVKGGLGAARYGIASKGSALRL